MGEITKYFCCKTIKLFLDNASENINDFKLQTPVSKLAYVNELFEKNEIYKQGVSKLVKT